MSHGDKGVLGDFYFKFIVLGKGNYIYMCYFTNNSLF
jgi:hypothetical protein